MTLLFFFKPHHQLRGGDDRPHAFGVTYGTEESKKTKKSKKKKTQAEKWNEEDDLALYWWIKDG
jgi:hypothetical protein